ncbi:MAG: hypothetical protein ABSE39_11475 [Candidatus Bathyarchaeia archaeon]|jgi:hypothetical protein
MGSCLLLGGAVPIANPVFSGSMALSRFALVVSFLLRKSGGAELEFLSTIILATFLLVAFNSTTRGLSQLLIDPHNHNPT